jgi:hypothetical protein
VIGSSRDFKSPEPLRGMTIASKDNDDVAL